MKVTVLSVWMALLWSSVLILLFYFLRRKLRFSGVLSISGVVVIYFFCMIRMFVPAEFPPWTKIVDGGALYRVLYEPFLTGIPGTDIRVSNILACVWIFGALILLYRICYEYIRAGRYYNGLPEIKGGREYELLSRIFPNIKGRPALSKSSVVQIPCCIGIIKKHILLPDKQYSDEELKYILMHEGSHAKNNDVLIRLLINILCAVYWWNPLVYLLRKDLNQSMEIRCDENVINGFDDEEKCNYLNVMLGIFKEYTDISVKDMRNAAMSFMESYPDRMVERFELVAKHKTRKYQYANIAATWLIAGCLLVFSYSFIIQPRYDAPVKEIETADIDKELDADESYLIKKADGSYTLYLDEFIPVDDDFANMLIDCCNVKVISEKAHAVYPSNSYIIETRDNEYYFCSEYEKIKIMKESVDSLIAAGFELRKENE